MRQQLVLILPPPPLHTQPLGLWITPQYTPPLDKTTGDRPYLSACGHQPVSLAPPLTTNINIFTPLNGTFLIGEYCPAAPSWSPDAHQNTHSAPRKLPSVPALRAPGGGRFGVIWTNSEVTY